MDSNSADTGSVPIQASGTPIDGAGEAWPMAVPVASGPLEPVTRGERFVTLDVLRGFAVLGILLVNIFSFAFVSERYFDWTWSTETPFDSLSQVGVHFFVVLKFITLFSMLFGMGLVLQWERARARNRPFVGMYSRRLLVLLVIGVLHGTLIWYGDVLSTYAVIGFLTLLLRGLRARTLIAVALFIFMLPLLYDGRQLLIDPDFSASDAAAERYEAERAERECAECDLVGNPPPLICPDEDPEKRYQWEVHRWCFMLDEERIYQSGTWSEVTTYRTLRYQHLVLNWYMAIHALRYVAMFLLGMGLMKLGLFRDRDESRPVYSGMVLYGLILGVPLSAVATYLNAWGEQDSASRTVSFICLYIGSLGMSLAYAGGLALLCLRVPWRKWLRPLAAVGQMGLSNYLGQSIICGLIFYGYGLGLFNRLGAVMVLLIAFGIFACQLVVSTIWLRHFRFGPFEWLWRTLTYLKIQPMRRRPVPAAAVQVSVVGEDSDDRLTR